jgi:uncharacterized protein
LPPLTPDERSRIIAQSPAAPVYGKTFDRESAYELLKQRTEATAATMSTNEAPADRKAEEAKPAGRSSSMWDGFFKSAARSLGTQVGRELIRGVLGSMTGTRRRR